MGKGRNRLAREKSPYLLQHADNPVDWYPWGDEAFAAARRCGKPVFLSIGYSTCHWCHVMARESFEDPKTASLINGAFIPVKVDREERPDIDRVYMTVCQMMTGSGGWPLTIIMTPEKEPFFAATYIPKQSRFGQTGLEDLIPKIRRMWEERREELVQSAARFGDLLRRESAPARGEMPGEELVRSAYEDLRMRFDRQYGGFGGAPKFPTPHHLTFLLRYWKRSHQQHALAMVEKTLLEMRLGGIYDHVGFGFHRYSTDERWLLPHFEKMLYDQALLAIAYLEAFQATGSRIYGKTAEEIFTFVLRELQSPEGGFYSAQDADSEGKEGKFYFWTVDEISRALGGEEAGFISSLFDVQPGGNFREGMDGRKTGANILHLSKSPEQIADEAGAGTDVIEMRVASALNALYEFRSKRVHPGTDNKILTDWNGLMIAALARGAGVLNRPDCLAAAEKAADFLLEKLMTGDGRLLHRYRDGEAAVTGILDDYAFLIWGLLELYESSFEVRRLERALELTGTVIRHFWDGADGGFFLTADDAETLILRKKEFFDGALPSGNSVSMLNLLRLSRMTGDPEHEAMAVRIGRAFSGEIESMPSGFTQFISAIDFLLGPSYEIVVAGRIEDRETREMLNTLHRRFVPNKVILLRPDEPVNPPITRIAEFTGDLAALEGKPTAYICSNHTCREPATDIRRMLELLA
ncbi:MAG TPA: thioredoxin domain-containing protein [Syntrophales bacterium]|nr:thioredoxin domain-containing protein [Syntrophales bacterium]